LQLFHSSSSLPSQTVAPSTGTPSLRTFNSLSGATNLAKPHFRKAVICENTHTRGLDPQDNGSESQSRHRLSSRWRIGTSAPHLLLCRVNNHIATLHRLPSVLGYIFFHPTLTKAYGRSVTLELFPVNSITWHRLREQWLCQDLAYVPGALERGAR
jgi:hypothetical protein